MREPAVDKWRYPPKGRREIPILTLKPEQINGLLERLQTLLFQRREQREWGLKYLRGRLMEGEKRYTQPLARQYCSETGKVDNCQVGVFLAYASSRGYTLLDRIK